MAEHQSHLDVATNGNGGTMNGSSRVEQAIQAERKDFLAGHEGGNKGGKGGRGVGTAWDSPGAAEWDFRSDTSTTPTASMLAAITRTTLLDDVVREDPTTNSLEATCAALLGHEAGLLTLSGTMGNQLAARTHLSSPPHAILADHRAHILTHEAGGIAALSQALSQPVVPSNGIHLSLGDVRSAAIVPLDPEDIGMVDTHDAPTRLICLENTLGGSILPLSEARAICEWARSVHIPTHLDGARLWEAVAAQVARGEHGGSLEAGLKAYGECFDSATVCFSKGLGAPLGSVLVGGERWIRKARHVRKSIGGGMRMTGLVAAPAAVAVRETFFGGGLERGHALARRVQKMWESRGGRCVGPVETNMVWIDLKGAGVDPATYKQVANEEGLKVYEDDVARIACHYQICEGAVEALGRVFARIMDDGRQQSIRVNGNGNGHGHGHDENGGAAAPGAGFKYGGGSGSVSKEQI